MIKKTLAEHEQAIKDIEGWIVRDKELLMNRLETQESDLREYIAELGRAVRKGLKSFVRGKI